MAKWCHRCAFRSDAVMHFRVCVPKRLWPDFMRVPQKPGPVATTVPEIPRNVSTELCECGLFAADKAKTRAWAAHQRGREHLRILAEREMSREQLEAQMMEAALA